MPLSTPEYSDDQIAQLARQTLAVAKKADKHNRDAYTSNYQFLNLSQWDPRELERRQNKRLVLTADQLNAPVDQVVNGVRQNRPGPKVMPEGGGSDIYDADIMEGVMRRVDYENSAWNAWELATECATGGNFGCFEMGLEYQDDHSFSRRITVSGIPNANECVWFDPEAIQRDRSDAEWAHRVYFLSPEKYLQMFGRETKLGKQIESRLGMGTVLKYIYSLPNRGDYSGWVSNDVIQVSKFYRVDRKYDTLRQYTDGVERLDSEKKYIKNGAKPLPGGLVRETETKEVKWYFVDCFEVVKQGTFGGPFIPLFPMYGRERWVGNMRFVSSLIQGAKDMQQALNFAITSACEILSAVSKTPWIGLAGQFRTKPNQWTNANSDIFAFMEYDEVLLPNGQYHVSAPQRDVSEPPINAFMTFANSCIGYIQRATGIFDQTLGRARADQSGRAIAELKEQSSEGTFHWASALTTCLTHYYRCMGDLIQREYDKETVLRIMRPNNKIEEALINSEFKEDPETKTRISYSLATGSFSYAVTVGPSSSTQRAHDAEKALSVIRILPPQMIGAISDLLMKVMDLGPLGEEMADRITPPQFRDQNDPQAMAAQLAQLTQQNEGLKQAVDQLQRAIAEKQPQLEVEKYVAELDAQVRIMTAQMKDGQQKAKQESANLLKALEIRTNAVESAKERMNRLQVVAINSKQDVQSPEEADEEDEEVQ